MDSKKRRRSLCFPVSLLALLVLLQACSSDKEEWVNPYPDLGWPNVHYDNRNSDRTKITGSIRFSEPWTALRGNMIGVQVTVGPEGNVYATVGLGIDAPSPDSCHLFAFDGKTGAQLWCTNEVNDACVASSALIDRDGNLYLADNEAMNSFTSSGVLRWKTPIEGFPTSAQFTPDGHIIFTTIIGRIYVLRRDTGVEVIEPVDTIEGAEYEPAPLDYIGCLAASSEGSCYSANTLAIDFTTGNFFFTLSQPGKVEADLVAMRYVGGEKPGIEPLWSNATLGGGSSTSPTLSKDNSRVYVNDNEGYLYAIDAASGDMAWNEPFYVGPANGSVSVADSSRLLPVTLTHVIALQDEGDYARVLWDREDIVNRGMPMQSGGDIGYIIAAFPDENQSSRILQGLQLLVIDLADGETLNEMLINDVEFGATMSIMGINREIYIAGMLTGLYGFLPLY